MPRISELDARTAATARWAVVHSPSANEAPPRMMPGYQWKLSLFNAEFYQLAAIILVEPGGDGQTPITDVSGPLLGASGYVLGKWSRVGPGRFMVSVSYSST